ncbi:nucleotidyltransferase family protein [Paenibacillus pini]|uniref:Nucleotidyltransferase family protein n=1 Tax=Paenibacillus pini JCM 16418 TaxID=1236976 RepID=W7YNQ2_9BACL|nr:nucleotidyltransferase family protein [Paenibacillus pini]GAF09243.1 hypothetical protein JCM16418_3365 [Paenibacillus pini JCM 16418]
MGNTSEFKLMNILGRLYIGASQKIKLIDLFKHNFTQSEYAKIQIDSVIEELKKNKVYEIGLGNISYLLSNIPDHKYLSGWKDRFLLTTVNDVSQEEAYKLIKKYDLDEDKILFIKGSALGFYYPKEYKRNTVDIDLIIRDIDYLWEILNRFEGSYDYDRLKLYINDKKGFTGSIDLESENKENVAVDIHLVNYFIWGGIEYPEVLWDRTTFENGILIPSKEDRLVMLIAHLANQWKYRIRDLNDLYIMIHQDQLDWNQVRILVEELNLNPFLNGLYDRMIELYGDDISIRKPEFLYPTLSSQLFFKYNLGSPKEITALPLEFSFTYNNYRKNLSILKSLYQTLYNSFNLVVFKNRAFYVNKKLKIKKWKPNSIFILKPFPMDLSLVGEEKKINKKYLSKNFYIVNEGKDNEVFVAKNMIWKQSSYY